MSHVDEPSTEILILAAGFSRRLGRPKQLAELEGVSLLARAFQTATEAAVGPVSVVLRFDDGPVLSEAGRLGCRVISNMEASEGLASSIRAGVQVVADNAAGALLLACDQPAVTAEHLRRLVRESQGCVIGSAYAGSKGVPAWFPARTFAELLQLRGDVGARHLLRDARALELAEGDLDIDREDDLTRARIRFRRDNAE